MDIQNISAPKNLNGGLLTTAEKNIHIASLNFSNVGALLREQQQRTDFSSTATTETFTEILALLRKRIAILTSAHDVTLSKILRLGKRSLLIVTLGNEDYLEPEFFTKKSIKSRSVKPKNLIQELSKTIEMNSIDSIFLAACHGSIHSEQIEKDTQKNVITGDGIFHITYKIGQESIRIEEINIIDTDFFYKYVKHQTGKFLLPKEAYGNLWESSPGKKKELVLPDRFPHIGRQNNPSPIPIQDGAPFADTAKLFKAIPNFKPPLSNGFALGLRTLNLQEITQRHNNSPKQ